MSTNCKWIVVAVVCGICDFNKKTYTQAASVSIVTCVCVEVEGKGMFSLLRSGGAEQNPWKVMHLQLLLYMHVYVCILLLRCGLELLGLALVVASSPRSMTQKSFFSSSALCAPSSIYNWAFIYAANASARPLLRLSLMCMCVCVLHTK